MKQFIFIILLVICTKSYSQNNTDEVNKIGISLPVVLNNSQGVFYALGSRKEPTGKGISWGINLNYSKSIYKNLFGIIGVGYFKQSFGIERPFNYITPDGSKPLVYTKKYVYNSVHFSIGIGYKKNVTKCLSIKGAVLYNWYSSYAQKYAPKNYFAGVSQINHKPLSIGNMINLNFGVEKRLNKKISLGFDFLLPLLIHWNNDAIFYKLGYANDEGQIAHNKFSIGASVSCNYHF